MLTLGSVSAGGLWVRGVAVGQHLLPTAPHAGVQRVGPVLVQEARVEHLVLWCGGYVSDSLMLLLLLLLFHMVIQKET